MEFLIIGAVIAMAILAGVAIRFGYAWRQRRQVDEQRDDMRARSRANIVLDRAVRDGMKPRR